MNWLEARFRRKFERMADGCLFRLWDREVNFSGAEVDEMVRERGRY